MAMGMVACLLGCFAFIILAIVVIAGMTYIPQYTILAIMMLLAWGSRKPATPETPPD